MKRAVALGCALACAGFTVVRDSDSLEPIRWSDPTVTMMLHDGMSSAESTAVQNSLAAWSNVGGSIFQFADGGTSGVDGDSEDGFNRISFMTTWPHSSGVVGVTTRVSNVGSPDTWEEGDIIFNADPSRSTWEWATDGRAGAHDVQSAVTHELGHVLGLMHTPCPEATMYFGGRRARTMWRTLHADDIAGVIFLYPASAFSCATDDQCPLYDNLEGGDHERTRCNGGSCVVGGSAVYGDACFENDDCATNNCLKGLDLAPGMDPGFCTQSCGSCPGNDLCQAGECFLGSDDCVVDDQVVDDDCQAGPTWRCHMDLDGRFRCLKPCQDNNQCAEVPGSVCHHNEGGTGSCRVPGLYGDGAACGDGYDCNSLICAGLGVQPVCVGGVGPVADGAPPHDGAWPGDAPTDGAAHGGDVDDPAVTGGCSCAARGSPSLLMFLLWFSRRRWR